MKREQTKHEIDNQTEVLIPGREVWGHDLVSLLAVMEWTWGKPPLGGGKWCHSRKVRYDTLRVLTLWLLCWKPCELIAVQAEIHSIYTSDPAPKSHAGWLWLRLTDSHRERHLNYLRHISREIRSALHDIREAKKYGSVNFAFRGLPFPLERRYRELFDPASLPATDGQCPF